MLLSKIDWSENSNFLRMIHTHFFPPVLEFYKEFHVKFDYNMEKLSKPRANSGSER